MDPLGGQPTCVATRMELKSVFWLPLIWFHNRRVQRAIRADSNLLGTALLIESPSCVWTLSFWPSPRATTGAAVREHAIAVHFAKRHCRNIWSTQWHLTRLSPTGSAWPQRRIDWTEIARLSGLDQSVPASMAICRVVKRDGSQRSQ